LNKKNIIGIFAVVLLLTGCFKDNTWSQKQYKDLTWQMLQLANLYSSKKMTSINDEEMKIAKCAAKNIMSEYSYDDYWNSLSNGKQDKRPKVLKLQKFMVTSLIDCNLNISARGYVMLAMQGLINKDDIPKNKLNELRNSYK